MESSGWRLGASGLGGVIGGMPINVLGLDQIKQ